MIDLREYFVKNVESKEYYFYKFGDYLVYYGVSEYKIFSDKEAINNFKELLRPENVEHDLETALEDEEKFIYLCFYLYCENYYIEEYPDFLSTPTGRKDLCCNKIKNDTSIKFGFNGMNGGVAWPDRRAFTESLEIKKYDDFYISKEINDTIKSISTRGADFNDMSLDEKLKEIANCIEYFLKKNNGKYEKVDCTNSCSFLTNDIIKEFRSKLQCFRHNRKESIIERNSFSQNQKTFLVNYGIVILQYIYDNNQELKVESC